MKRLLLALLLVACEKQRDDVAPPTAPAPAVAAAAATQSTKPNLGEVELHLHHDRDTAEGLRGRLQAFKETLASRHGLLARHKDSGELAYAYLGVFVAMLILMRAWGTGWTGSTVSALAYAFGTPILFLYCNIIYLVGAAWTPLGFRGVDRWLSIAASGESEWRALVEVLGRPDWMDDRRFADAYRRRRNEDALDDLRGTRHPEPPDPENGQSRDLVRLHRRAHDLSCSRMDGHPHPERLDRPDELDQPRGMNGRRREQRPVGSQFEQCLPEKREILAEVAAPLRAVAAPIVAMAGSGPDDGWRVDGPSRLDRLGSWL